MPSEHLSASTSRGGRRTSSSRKATCETCNHTVRITTVEGQQLVTDTELITVITDRGSSHSRVTAHRLHAESCARLQRATEQEKLRADRKAWEKSNPGKDWNREAEKLVEAARADYLEVSASLKRVARAVSRLAAPRRGKRTKGM